MSNLNDKELTKRENYTVLDAASETISGAAEAVKESLVGAKEALFGKAEDVTSSAQGETLPQVWSKADEAACNAETLVQEAKVLQREGCQQIGMGEAELAQAQKAQQAAALVAERANAMTEQALSQEIAGQEKLVTAGNKLMQAGAELQQQAAGMGTHQAEINVHATSQIAQDTKVVVAPVQQAEFHVLQSRVGAECRPVIEHREAHEKIDFQGLREIH